MAVSLLPFPLTPVWTLPATVGTATEATPAPAMAVSLLSFPLTPVWTLPATVGTANRGLRSAPGNGCVAVTVSANASVDFTGHGWDCNRGYAWLRQWRSVAVTVPANASVDLTSGHGWDCNRGCCRAKAPAMAVSHAIVPANASVDFTGHGWDCNRGYARSGNGCVVPASFLG